MSEPAELKHTRSGRLNMPVGRFVYLQRLQETKGAQSSAPRHQTEGGVVEHLLVVVPAQTQQTHMEKDQQTRKGFFCFLLNMDSCDVSSSRGETSLNVTSLRTTLVYYQNKLGVSVREGRTG